MPVTATNPANPVAPPSQPPGAAHAGRGARPPVPASIVQSEQLRREGAAIERSAVVDYARAKADAVARMVERGHLTAQEGSMLQRRLRGFADDIAAGLHA
jgi:hypothetical protein